MTVSRTATPAPVAALRCLRATSRADRDTHLAIRTAVFVREQRIFPGSDADERDEDPATIHVLGYVGCVPGGVVRLYPLGGDGLWRGDRLAVLPPWRAAGLGVPLVRYAVATAGALGGSRMTAWIQPGNVRFFERLGWARRGGLQVYVGRPHQQMEIPLR